MLLIILDAAVLNSRLRSLQKNTLQLTCTGNLFFILHTQLTSQKKCVVSVSLW